MNVIRNGFIPLLFLLPAGLSAQSLYIGNGAGIVMKGNIKLVLNNTGIINNGSFVPDSSTVLFTGDASSNIASIQGQNPVTFFNAAITKPANDVLMYQNITVNGTLTMNNGNLQLNGYALLLNSTGLLAGEKDQSRVIGEGYISASRNTNTFKVVNPGNLGISITRSASLGTVTATVTVTRTHTPVALTTGGIQSIARVYSAYYSTAGGSRGTTVSPSTVTPTFNISFHYLTPELNGISEAGLNLWNGGGAYWSSLGRSSLDTALNVVAKTGVLELGTFTLGPPAPSGARAPKEEPTIVTAPATLFPNPAHDRFVLTLYSDKEKDGAIGLYNQSGYLLQRRQIHFHTGANTLEWNISGYAPGIYYLRPEGNAAETIKIIRQ